MCKYVVVSLICIYCLFLYFDVETPHGNDVRNYSESSDMNIQGNKIEGVVQGAFSECDIEKIRKDALQVSRQRQSEVEYVDKVDYKLLYDNLLFSMNWVPKISNYKYASQQERINDANKFIDRMGLRHKLIDYLNGKQDNGFFKALLDINANFNVESVGVWSLIFRFKKVDISELMILQSVLYAPDVTVVIHAYLDRVDRNILNEILNNLRKQDFPQSYTVELFLFAIKQKSSEFLMLLLDSNFPQSLGLYSLLDLQDYPSINPNTEVIAIAEILHSHGIKFNISPYLTDAWIWLPSSILKNYDYPDYYSPNILETDSRRGVRQKFAIVERQFKLLEQMKKCNLSRDDIFSDHFTKENDYNFVSGRGGHELESEKIISAAEEGLWLGGVNYYGLVQSGNWDRFVDDASREESAELRDTLYRLMISEKAPVEFIVKAVKNEGHVSHDIIVHLALSGDFAALDKIKDTSLVSSFDFEKFQLLYGGKIDEKKIMYMKQYSFSLATAKK